MEMEDEILNVIKDNKMIKPGETIGVAVSGGVDSMSLLHFLFANKDILDCQVVAITVNHMLRGQNAVDDVNFVKDWCKRHGILCYKYSVDCNKIAEENNLCVEDAARKGRYGVFENLLKQNFVDKIALAHHISDQAETILLHILRGSGLNGACGMEYVRDDKFIRPFLSTKKEDIIRYASKNYISHVEDETNSDNKFGRNFLRNQIIPLLRQKWEGVEQNLINFSKICKEDNNFILSHVCYEGIIYDKDLIKIPLLYFHYADSIINRIIFSSLEKINADKNIEKKHIDLIKNLANQENGKKINLPNDLIVQKEYEYLTFYKNEKIIVANEYPLKSGGVNFAGLYDITIKTKKKIDNLKENLVVDKNLIPKDAVWRTRKKGDYITKFGGGTKTIKEFFIDKKISSRERNFVPLLAKDNEIFCVGNIAISDKVKISEKTKSAYLISVKKIKNI